MNLFTASRPLWQLFCLGIVMTVIFAIISVASRGFVYEAPQTVRPLLFVLALFAISCLVYLLALRVCLKIERQSVLPMVVGFGIAFRLLLLFSVPIQEIDIYRYIWDGQVTLSGTSPFAFPPETVLHADRASNENLELQRLAELRDATPAKRLILERIHYGHLPTVYPPVSQAVFAAAAATTPRSSSFEAHVIVMKVWVILFDIASIVLIAWMHRWTKQHPGWLLSYAWCPLVLKEFANSGHLDAIAVALSISAILALLRSNFSVDPLPENSRARWNLLAGFLLGLGVGAKLYPLVLFPLSTLTVWKKSGWRQAIGMTALFFVTTAVVLAPLWNGNAGTSETSLVGPTLPEYHSTATDPQAGLKVFFSRWMMNDFIFLNITENLTPDRLREGQPSPWFVFMPDSFRDGLTRFLFANLQIDESRISFFVARGVTAFLFVILCCRFAWRAARSATSEDWLRGVFRTLAWFWLLLPTLNPWYWIWALPWIAYARSRLWLLMSCQLFAYYLRFHFAGHYPDSRVVANLPYNGEQFFDFVVVWFEYFPWLIAFAGEALYRYWTKLTSADARWETAIASDSKSKS